MGGMEKAGGAWAEGGGWLKRGKVALFQLSMKSVALDCGLMASERSCQVFISV